MRSIDQKVLLGIALMSVSVSSQAQQKPANPEASYPPQQRHFCDVVRSGLAKQSQYAGLNPMQKAQTPPPDPKEMSRQLMAALGPSLEFSGWRGYFSGVLHDKEVSVQFRVSCFLYMPNGLVANTRDFTFMGPAGRDDQNVYPEAHWLGLSDPIVQKLTALPNNAGQATASGHLFQAKGDPSSVVDPTAIRRTLGKPLDGGPALAVFTNVTFLSGK